MVRSPYTDKSGLKKGAWSEEEDNKLRAYVQRYGHWNWRQLPKYAGVSRCGKSCRLRWLNYLRPDVKRGNYSVEEEDLIIKLQKQFGNRWSAIAARFPGRTDNEIKNYWHTRLRKRIKQDSQSFEKMEQYSEMSKHMDDADQHEQFSEMSSFDPEQKREILEPEPAAAASGNADSAISSFSCDLTLFDGIDKFEEDSNSSLKSFTDPLESFWRQPFALDASHDNNNHWLPSVEEEFTNPFSYFLDDDINWFRESIQESLF